MKKMKLYKIGMKELHDYLISCSEAQIHYDSKILQELIKFNIQEICVKLQKKTLELIHKYKTTITVQFTRGEILTLSYLFKVFPCSSYLKMIEYSLLSGLTL